MIRLITNRGKQVPILEVVNESDPQELLNSICQKCFNQRRQHIGHISDRVPFDKERARKIMDIMIIKGLQDPKAFALGSQLRMNWSRFEKL